MTNDLERKLSGMPLLTPALESGEQAALLARCLARLEQPEAEAGKLSGLCEAAVPPAVPGAAPVRRRRRWLVWAAVLAAVLLAACAAGAAGFFEALTQTTDTRAIAQQYGVVYRDKSITADGYTIDFVAAIRDRDYIYYVCDVSGGSLDAVWPWLMPDGPVGIDRLGGSERAAVVLRPRDTKAAPDPAVWPASSARPLVSAFGPGPVQYRTGWAGAWRDAADVAEALQAGGLRAAWAEDVRAVRYIFPVASYRTIGEGGNAWVFVRDSAGSVQSVQLPLPALTQTRQWDLDVLAPFPTWTVVQRSENENGGLLGLDGERTSLQAVTHLAVSPLSVEVSGTIDSGAQGESCYVKFPWDSLALHLADGRRLPCASLRTQGQGGGDAPGPSDYTFTLALNALVDPAQVTALEIGGEVFPLEGAAP